jgi:mannosyltransferase OCH1-like enzyme
MASNVVPKIVHMYWHTPDMPGFIVDCIQSVKNANPEWDVRIYHKYDIEEHASGDVPEFVYRKYNLPKFRDVYVKYVSDWFRLYVMYKYGGVYIDMGCICINGFDTLIDMTYPHLQGNNSFIDAFDCMENGFLAAAPADPFIKEWICETVVSHQDYGSREKYSEVNFKYGPQLIGWLPYLVQHLAWRKVADTNTNFRLLPHVTSPVGPYFWNGDVSKLLRMKESDFHGVTFVKFNSNHRAALKKFMNLYKQSHLYIITQTK